MRFGLKVKHIEYLKLNWRMPPSFEALFVPMVKWAAGSIEFMQGRQYKRLLGSKIISWNEKFGAHVSGTFYWKKPLVLVAVISFAVIGLLANGLLFTVNPFLALKLGTLWIIASLFLAEAINAPAVLYHWENDVSLTKALWSTISGVTKNFIFFNVLIPLYNIKGIAEGVKGRPLFPITKKDLVLKGTEPKRTTELFTVRPMKVAAVLLPMAIIAVPSTPILLVAWGLYVAGLFSWVFGAYILNWAKRGKDDMWDQNIMKGVRDGMREVYGVPFWTVPVVYGIWLGLGFISPVLQIWFETVAFPLFLALPLLPKGVKGKINNIFTKKHTTQAQPVKNADKQKLLDSHPEVVEKLKVLKFLDKYNIEITIDAFEKGRSTIFNWKRQYLDKGMIGLINHSRKPYNTRRMYIDDQIFKFIKGLRDQYPKLSKTKIRPLLDDYCHKHTIKTISESKIGRIIKRNNWFLYLGKRHKGKIRTDRKRAFAYSVNNPGDLFQIDTIVRFEHGIKRYLLTAIDVNSKFAFSYTYKNHSSRSASDFVDKLVKVTPYPIYAIQTDNGSEFLAEFDKTIAKRSIVHFFTYPRCPKQNGCVERFNRTLQEDLVDPNAIYLEETNLDQFNNLLIDYLLFYNTKRIHQTLGNIVPMRAVINYLKKSNMYRTGTDI